MGRLTSLALVLLAACGDNGIADPGGDGTLGGIDHPPGHGGGDVATRLAPAVCGASDWNLKVANAKVELSVATRDGTAAITTMPIGGGAATGLLVDRRMNMTDSGTLGVGTFDRIGVSFLANRFVSTGIASDAVYAHLLQDDLTSPEPLMKAPATAIAKPAFYASDANIIMPVGGNDGITVYRFADSYEPMDSSHVASTGRVQALSAAQYGATTIAAWSTTTNCHMMQLDGISGGPLATSNEACPDARFAINPSTGYGMLVFSGADGVHMTQTGGAEMAKGSLLAMPDTSSPRVLFDGKHFWISMLDVRGDVVVGVLDDHHNLTTMSLNGPLPYGAGYELTMLDGAPWVFAVDANGYTGTRLCAVAE